MGILLLQTRKCYQADEFDELDFKLISIPHLHGQTGRRWYGVEEELGSLTIVLRNQQPDEMKLCAAGILFVIGTLAFMDAYLTRPIAI